MESAVFAYTVGIANFCGMVSSLLGSGVIQWSGMRTVASEGEICDFEALPYLIVLFQILLPILIGIPAVLLIPNVLQTEPLIDWEKETGWSEERAAGEENEDDDHAEDSRLEPPYL